MKLFFKNSLWYHRGMRQFWIFLLFATLILTYPASVYAQEEIITDVPENLLGIDGEIFQSLSREMQEELLKETEQVSNACLTKTIYRQLHDCNCLAGKFLDERLLRGPEEDQRKILDDLKSTCPNMENTAAFAYNNCIETNKIGRTRDLEGYCKCFANNLAIAYADQPYPHIEYFSQLSIGAYRKCDQYVD